MMLGALGKLGGVVAARFYPPELTYVTDPGYLASILDTLQMSFLGGILGVFLQSHWPGSLPGMSRRIVRSSSLSVAWV